MAVKLASHALQGTCTYVLYTYITYMYMYVLYIELFFLICISYIFSLLHCLHVYLFLPPPLAEFGDYDPLIHTPEFLDDHILFPSVSDAFNRYCNTI